MLFLTLVSIEDINERNLYADLMRKFRDEGHDVYIVTPLERRYKQNTILINKEGTNILRVRTLNIQKTNIVEKGISTLLIQQLYISAIKKYFPWVKFDLLLYSTPPVTFTKLVKTIKKRDGATSYLLLKDIFPQNAIDLGMMKANGILHLFFRRKEKQMYAVSDFIGCMSPANVEYVIRHNPEIKPHRVEENPNSIEPETEFISAKERISIRNRFGIPTNKTTFIYGGNLGKPQGIDFLLEVLGSNKEKKGVFFVIVGTGTEFLKVQNWFAIHHPANAILLSGLPKNEYDQLIQSCDVGMIFLDRRFTIPNFPSRLLSYLEYKMPVIAATDSNTDMGKIMEENNFGFWCESGDLEKMNQHIACLLSNKNEIQKMGLQGYQYLIENYTVSTTYQKIINQLNYSK